MPKKYRSKKIEEAIKLTRESADEVVEFIGKRHIVRYNLGKRHEDSCYIDISSMEGISRAEEGDYVIKSSIGQFRPNKPDFFEKNYEEIIDQ